MCTSSIPRGLLCLHRSPPNTVSRPLSASAQRQSSAGRGSSYYADSSGSSSNSTAAASVGLPKSVRTARSGSNPDGVTDLSSLPSACTFADGTCFAFGEACDDRRTFLGGGRSDALDADVEEPPPLLESDDE